MSELVSVIMPIYNRASTCSLSIESVLNQSYKNIELVIVDDHSDDYKELQKVIETFDDSRIKLVRHYRNKNGAVARNTGVEHSTGNVIAFIDSDDFWVESKLELQYKLLSPSTVVGSNSFIVYSDNYQKKIPSEASVKCYNQLTPLDILFGKLKNTLCLQTSVMMMHKETFNKTKGFDPLLFRHQDYQLALDLFNVGVLFVFVDDCLSHYVKSKKNILVNKGWSIDKSCFFLEKYADFFEKRHIENFLIVQLLIPSIRNKVFSEWLKLCQKMNISLLNLSFKAMCFLVCRFYYRFQGI